MPSIARKVADVARKNARRRQRMEVCVGEVIDSGFSSRLVVAEKSLRFVADSRPDLRIGSYAYCSQATCPWTKINDNKWKF